MTRLKIDTWDPEYGSSFEALAAEPGDPSFAEQVEDGAWAPIVPSTPPSPLRIAFIDGVRRIDSRLFAEDATGAAPAVAGTWAVGVAWADTVPTIDGIRVGRELVIAGEPEHPGLRITIGTAALDYQSTSTPDNLDPVYGLQREMRQAEARLLADLFAGGDADLIVQDGPLTYFAPAGQVAGIIKRQKRSYLRPDQGPIFTALQVGDRTPVFAIGEDGRDRYSWYARIGPRRPIDGTMTGIVRLETATTDGIDAARRVADLTSAVLPRFATEWGRDPRAPQNLYPIAQLERELHHRLGDRLLIRRSIEAALWSHDD